MEEETTNEMEMAAQEDEKREKAEKTAQSGIKIVIFNYTLFFPSKNLWNSDSPKSSGHL